MMLFYFDKTTFLQNKGKLKHLINILTTVLLNNEHNEFLKPKNIKINNISVKLNEKSLANTKVRIQLCCVAYSVLMFRDDI